MIERGGSALLAAADGIERRIVRHAALTPCPDARVDMRASVSGAEEDFTTIAHGVSGNAPGAARAA